MFMRPFITKIITILVPVFIVMMVVWLMISCIIFFLQYVLIWRVTQLVEKHAGDDVYRPVFVFTDGSGVEHKISSSFGNNPPRFPVGSKVSILYQATDPDDGED